ncbi:MAG: proprotein convertase P-domain-containing protein [Pseudomonadota bacterium]
MSTLAATSVPLRSRRAVVGRGLRTDARSKGPWVGLRSAALAALALCFGAATALGQTSSYTASPTGGTIGSTTACGTTDANRFNNALEVDFVVPTSIAIGDVDLGFQATHTYRTDINMALFSPSGTRVDLLSGNFGANLDNYDVLFDDDTTGPVVDTGSHASADDVSAPFFDNEVRSEADSLADFNNEDAAGTWTLRMCDVFVDEDDGTFERATLFITPVDPTNIDLSVTVTANTTTPTFGTSVVLTVEITNGGPASASGITVSAPLPSGLVYQSDTASGAYDPGTATWTVGSLAVGASTSFQITADVLATDGYTTTAEVSAAAETDIDSTPGNAATQPGEDDTGSVTLTPQSAPSGPAGTPPTLSCPVALRTFAWSGFGWTAGDLTDTDTQNGDTLTVTVTDPTNDLIPSDGAATPAFRNTVSYGEATNPGTLYFLTNFENTAEEITTQFDIGVPGQGVENLQLRGYDVDTGTNGTTFIDSFTVTGSLGGVDVPITLTNGEANAIAFNTIYGLSGVGDSVDDATLFITAETPIDRLIVRWGSGPNAQANPAQQGIGFGDLTYCPRQLSAELVGNKSVAMHVPGEHAIPGNDVIYTISFTNTGAGSVDSDAVEIIDPLPADVIFYNGDVDDGGTATDDAVLWMDNGSGLIIDFDDDIGFASTAMPAPVDFDDCTYDPAVGYDPLVSHICINPTGTMLGGDPDPSFSVSFRAQIR